MKRISHDLPGVGQRLARLRDALQASAEETAQVWQDDKGEQFFRQYIAHVAPALSGLVTSLSQTIEQFEDIAKRVQDPDKS